MQNRYQIQQNISGTYDVIDTEYTDIDLRTGKLRSLIQEPSMTLDDATVHAALLNCEHLRDARRAAKEQRKGRANADCTCCAGNESQWFSTDSCQLHIN